MFRRYGVINKLMYEIYEGSIHMFGRKVSLLTNYVTIHFFLNPVQDQNFVAIAIKIENSN